MKLPVEGGAPEFAGLELPASDWLSLDPSGRRLAFSAAAGTDQIWALDNVLAPLKTAR